MSSLNTDDLCGPGELQLPGVETSFVYAVRVLKEGLYTAQDKKRQIQLMPRLVHYLGPTHLPLLFKALTKYSLSDNTIILLALVKALPDIAMQVSALGEQSYVEMFYPDIFKNLLSNSLSLVVDSAVSSLKEVLKTFQFDTMKIYTSLVAIAHLTEDDLALRVRTLAQGSSIFGIQLCKAFTVPILTALSENRSSVVRCALAESLPHLAMWTPLPKFEFIIERLLVDPEVSQELVKVSPQLLHFVRRTVKELLANFLMNAIDSYSKPLRHKAKLALGPFISEFGPIVPQALIDKWLELASGHPWQAKICAEYTPGVLLNMGLEFWPSCSGTFLALSKNKDKEVRLQVGKVLRDVAHLIGKDQAARDLAPIFVSYLKDASLLPDTIECASNFLSGLSSAIRITVAGHYLSQVYIAEDWRVLHSIAQQLDAIANLLAASESLTLLLPATLQLLEHNVATVREAAAPSIASMLILHEDAELLKRLLETLERFMTSRNWQNRSLAAIMCMRLVESREAFEKFAFVSFAELCKDPVANIRIRAAEVVSKALRLNYTDSYWESLRSALLNDSVPEVRRRVSEVDEPLMRIVRNAPSEVEFEVSLDFATEKPALINCL
mmetsp:Transcript_3518/g.7312  ORF Transcript_3518/g.7312 Transcript_3518/m.7312 type:complete len:611 (-) Transcript_3518:4334-6166(-)